MSNEINDFLSALNGAKGELDAWLEVNNEAECRAAIKAAITTAAQPEQAKPTDLLADIRAYIERVSVEQGYGYMRTANPHDFIPDGECCTEEEIAAHEAACEAYDKGMYTPERGSEWVGKCHILRAPWGIGGYTYRDEEAATLLARIDSHLTAPHGESDKTVGSDHG